MPDLPIMQAHFCVLSNPEAHLNTVFSKTMWCNPYAPTIWNMNKWESILHMDGYYVVKITVAKYLGHEGIITNVSKEDKAYLVSIADILQCICPNFTRMSFLAMRKRCQWVSCKYLHYVFIYVFASICTSVFLSCQEGFKKMKLKLIWCWDLQKWWMDSYNNSHRSLLTTSFPLQSKRLTT